WAQRCPAPSPPAALRQLAGHASDPPPLRPLLHRPRTIPGRPRRPSIASGAACQSSKSNAAAAVGCQGGGLGGALYRKRALLCQWIEAAIRSSRGTSCGALRNAAKRLSGSETCTLVIA